MRAKSQQFEMNLRKDLRRSWCNVSGKRYGDRGASCKSTRRSRRASVFAAGKFDHSTLDLVSCSESCGVLGVVFLGKGMVVEAHLAKARGVLER